MKNNPIAFDELGNQIAKLNGTPLPTTNNLEGWREEFDKKYTFTEDGVGYLKFDYCPSEEKCYTRTDKIKQFISDLRKHDVEVITEMNSCLRSAYSIAERKGETTNWEAFSKMVKLLLKETRNYK